MTKNTNKPARSSHLRWVKLADLKVNPVAQREFRPAWAKDILNRFDLDKFQVPHVNHRADDGGLYIMEGQHGTWAYRQWIGDDEQQIQVWQYEGLTEQEEAEFFLSLNNKKNVGALDKFKVAVVAGRELESDIDRIVRANKCRVTTNKDVSGAISAVGALTSIYSKFGGVTLGEAIRTIRDSFGDGGYERTNLLGVAMFLARYQDADRDRLTAALRSLPNGSKGLIQMTNLVKEQMGTRADESAAGAVTDLYNKGRGGKKVPSWWRAEAFA